MISTQLSREERERLLADFDATKADALAALNDDGEPNWKTRVAEHRDLRGGVAMNDRASVLRRMAVLDQMQAKLQHADDKEACAEELLDDILAGALGYSREEAALRLADTIIDSIEGEKND